MKLINLDSIIFQFAWQKLNIALALMLQKSAHLRIIVSMLRIRLSAGAEFIVAIAGDIMTMPGLPKKPTYEVCVGERKY